MKIGILGAMVEEVSSIKDLMVIKKETTIAGRTYYEGRIDKTEIILTFSRWGKVASSSTTTTLINNFNVDFVLFTGVAGAVDESLNIGDMVIGSSLYQHDMDARPFFNQFQIPLTSTIFFKPHQDDIDKAILAANQFVTNIRAEIGNSLLDKFSILDPSVHSGIIASGDRFIANPKAHENLVLPNVNDKTLAIEMEGAAVSQVCEDYNIPYIIIRTISDKANHSAPVDFVSFVELIASKYSSCFVKLFVKNIEDYSSPTIHIEHSAPKRHPELI